MTLWRDPAAVRVLGMGSALPDAAVSTAALVALVESRFGLSLGRRAGAVALGLGIETRHVCRPFAHAIEPPRPGQRNPELAAAALRGALAEAGLEAGGLAYIIAHTATPAMPLPSNVAEVAAILGYGGPFVELRQACTGFANALVFALGLLRAGPGPVAIVGSETGSVHFDPRQAAADPGQLVNLLQMGDGAGAIVLARDDGGPGARLSHLFHGQMGPGGGLRMPEGGSDSPGGGAGVIGFEHDFRAIRLSGGALLQRCRAAAAEAGVGCTDWTLPHQANGRMDAICAGLFGIPAARVVNTGRTLGNTGSAAIWLGLAQHRARLQPGETVAVLGAEATAQMFGGFRYAHG